jgi:hypothetical protein
MARSRAVRPALPFLMMMAISCALERSGTVSDKTLTRSLVLWPVLNTPCLLDRHGYLWVMVKLRA